MASIDLDFTRLQRAPDPFSVPYPFSSRPSWGTVLSGPQAKNSGVIVLFLTYPTSNSSAQWYIFQIQSLSITTAWVQALWVTAATSICPCSYRHLSPPCPRASHIFPLPRGKAEVLTAPVCWLPSALHPLLHTCPTLPLLIKPPILLL